jgi:hypothetical protein
MHNFQLFCFSPTANEDDNENVVWEEFSQNSSKQASSPLPVTHWRQASSTISYKGRFPARVSLTPATSTPIN